jgi:cysteinyl-tRNA synthetase
MDTLKLYNTETRKKEEILSKRESPLLLYTCGPTVYDFAHIGNFRTYVFEDLLKRTLLFLGYSVRHVMNITDIDDKTIRGANRKKISLKEYTDPFTRGFFEDIQQLNILPADAYPHATDYIGEMIQMIEVLLEKGHAYRGQDGSIYFSLRSFPKYGRLSHLKLEELKEGASQRILSDEYEKESAADFVLWKSYDQERDGPIYWESPFGKGRPGWHIECSAMSLKLLGTTIDLHCGGVDNIFPHHENEIAQSECYTASPFVRYWVHSAHLLVDHKKMSKSLGNFYTLRDLLQKGYSGKEVRFLLMQVHYRMQLNFTMEGLESARASLKRINDFVLRLQGEKKEKIFGTVSLLLEEAKKGFVSALSDDLNLSSAMSFLFDLIREINTLLDQERIGFKEAREVLALLETFEKVLGFLPIYENPFEAPLEVKEALEKRNRAREEKNWKEADLLRAFIEAKGYVIEDTSKGPVLKKR